MTTAPIAVTGATGHLGGLVARHLDHARTPQRLVVRDPASPRVPDLASVVDVRAAQYGAHDAAVHALEGARLLFMVSASESADRPDQHRTFVDAAVAAGVQHIVYTSFLGAAPDAAFTLARDHYATEEHIKTSGLAWTFLRDSLYIDFLPSLPGPDGVIRGPAEDGVVGAVARADIGRAAAAVLAAPDSHAGATYDLTGREALSLDDVARIITDTTGTPATFHNETPEEAYASRAVYGAPDWQVDAWVSTYTAIARGELSLLTSTVADLTGRQPLTLRDYLTR